MHAHAAPDWQRYIRAGVLCVWGSVALAFVATGRVDSYLHPSFHVWTVVSGIVLVAMAAGVLFFPARHACSDCCGGAHGAHGASSLGGVMWRAAVLVVPLLVATVSSPGQFGPVAVMNRGLAVSLAALPAYEPFREPPLPGSADSPGAEWDTGSFLQKNAAGQIVVTPVDLLYAANMEEMRGDFDGKEIEVVGQFFPAKRGNPHGDRFSLVRMFVMCCAADARPVAIPVTIRPPASFPDMSWVKVAGRVTFPLEGGQRIPLIEAASVEPCPQPEETFIY